jgi:small subunit ribosomal protein S20
MFLGLAIFVVVFLNITLVYSKNNVYLHSQFWARNLKSKRMANHKSSIKRIRSNNAKRLQNRYYAKTTRTALKTLRATTAKKEAEELLPKVSAMLDKLAKRNVIHKNKAANLKSKLSKKINTLSK